MDGPRFPREHAGEVWGAQVPLGEPGEVTCGAGAMCELGTWRGSLG